MLELFILCSCLILNFKFFIPQLAAALASAQQGSLFGGMTGLLGQSQHRPAAASSGGPASNPSGSSSSLFSRSNPSSSGGFITSDQLAAALAAASPHFAAAGQQQPQRNPPPSAVAGSMEANLARMREMGVVDQGLARRALEVMEGDLQAAIDLIFTGWLGEDDSAN